MLPLVVHNILIVVYSIIIILGVVGNLAILIAFIGNKVCGSVLGMNKPILD